MIYKKNSIIFSLKKFKESVVVVKIDIKPPPIIEVRLVYQLFSAGSVLYYRNSIKVVVRYNRVY